jgi:chromosome segregation ATPase
MNENNSQISSGTNSELYRLLAMHQKQIEDNQTHLQEIREQISDIRTDLAVIPEKLSSGSDRLKESVNSLGARLGSVEERIRTQESQFALAQRDIVGVLQTKESWDKAMWAIFIALISGVAMIIFVNNNPFFNPKHNNPNPNPNNSGEASK